MNATYKYYWSGIRFLVFNLLILCQISCNRDTVPSSLQVGDMECEYLENPLGVDVLNPRLSWRFKAAGIRGEKQTAYRIIVATSPDKLSEDEADLWDSGKVRSDQSIHVTYNGKPLKSGMKCFWKVMVWDKEGKPSAWSEPAFWSMGLLHPDDWLAGWIVNPDPERLSHPWLRRTFDLKEESDQAMIHVNTGSFYELYINGEKVSPYVLTPGIAQTDKRFHINTYDVTSYLVKGKNCIAFWMGPGWHQAHMGNTYNAPLLRAQLNIHSPSGLQVVGTDSSWRVRESCISQIGTWIWNDFGGEKYDARAFIPDWNKVSYDDTQWHQAREIPAPDLTHSWLGCESAILSPAREPQKIYQLDNGKWVIDFGSALCGWMELKMHNLKPGQEVSIHYADLNTNDYDRPMLLTDNGATDGYQHFNQQDIYIASGEGSESFCPRFNHHSFRYAVISGLNRKPGMGDAKAMMIEPDFRSAGQFECSNKLLNEIHEITRYTFRTQNPCLALGTGEPREKSAYGDGGAHLSGYLYNFTCDANIRKWIRDWSDAQREDGWFRHTAPSFEDHGGGPAWGGQVSELVRRMVLYYGDTKIVEQMYDKLRKYVDYVESKTQDGILRAYTPTERGVDWMFIGDWVRPTEVPDNSFNMDSMKEREFFNNSYRVLLWEQLAWYARILGKADEYTRCEEHLAKIRSLIHNEFYLPEKGTYLFNNQGCLSIALYARIPPPELRPEILAQLEHDIVADKKGHLNTGLLGTFIMLDLLTQENRSDLIALMMNQTTYPGWGYLIKEMDVKTWPEGWAGAGSQVILVVSNPGSWFFEGLGGIRPDPEKPGFKNIILKPAVVKSVDRVNCSYQSPYGEIVSNWNVDEDQFEWEVTVPPNSTAIVNIPGRDINESGMDADESDHITFLRNEDQCSVFEVESGHYFFNCTLSR